MISKIKKRLFGFGLYSVACLSLFAQKGGRAATPVYLDENKAIEQRVEDALSRMTLEEKVAMVHAQSNFSSAGCPRLGIPELWMSDGPHGVRAEVLWGNFDWANWTTDSCTAFPALTCLAASFNPDMAYAYGEAIGAEARYRKKDVLLAPGVNIYRSPLNGRNFEYMGEDPYLASRLAVPYIQGVQTNGVAACVKHYALNNQEQWRGSINVVVDDRALHEIYLPAFKASVLEGGTWALMGSYNKYKGQHCCHNDFMLNKILKQDWGFDGAVVSDWSGTHSTDEAATNGLDVEMGTWTDGLKLLGRPFTYNDYFLANPYLKGLKEGRYAVKDLDDKVRRMLRLCFRTNMDRHRPYGSFATPEHADVARKIGEEGIVLLKNDKGFFPIAPGRYSKILVVGENAVRSLTVGGGSSELKVKREISPLQGLKEKYGDDRISYTMGYTSDPSKFNVDSLKQQAIAMAKDAEVVLFIGGLNKDAHQDCEGEDRQIFELPYEQGALISQLAASNKNTGVIIISGNGVSMPWLKSVPALMQSWYLGSEAGYATANVVSGEVNPSGKMPFSIPVKLEDNAAHHFGTKAFPGDGTDVVYEEGILVGYRWHDTKKIPALFPFGYGMSYTTFSYGKMATNKKVYGKEDTIELSFTLANDGKCAGAEAAQIYVSQSNPLLERPVKELKAFKKVFLDAGERKVVSLSIPVKELAYYDDKKQDWVVDSDQFTLHCGASSTDIKSSVSIQVQ